MYGSICGGAKSISIHALREEGDEDKRRYLSAHCISIHALREEGDTEVKKGVNIVFEFLSTPSARRATSCGRVTRWTLLNFYPRPPRGGRRVRCRSSLRINKFLSTPSARRATGGVPRTRGRASISIHALREEGDVGITVPVDDESEFLSTPSARRATFARWACAYNLAKFLSTPSARRATKLPTLSSDWIKISIHALREEGDGLQSNIRGKGENFYPRPPRGGRPCRH